jgi:hypothetical protein
VPAFDPSSGTSRGANPTDRVGPPLMQGPKGHERRPDQLDVPHPTGAAPRPPGSEGGGLQRDLGEQVHLGRIGDGGVEDQLVHADSRKAGDGLLDRLG